MTDWRTPAARPFYIATAANPEEVTLRRHFRTKGRHLESFHDDELQLTSKALLDALNAPGPTPCGTSWGVLEATDTDPDMHEDELRAVDLVHADWLADRHTRDLLGLVCTGESEVDQPVP